MRMQQMAATGLWAPLSYTIKFHFSLLALLGVGIFRDIIGSVESDVMICCVGVDEGKVKRFLAH